VHGVVDRVGARRAAPEVDFITQFRTEYFFTGIINLT
jgi:hypothetical protein